MLFRHLFVLLICQRTAGVIVSNITLVTESNRTDYILQGEVGRLYCNYQTANDETVSSVRWEWKRRGTEESMEIYVWRPGRRPVAKEIFFGRTDVSNIDPSYVVIRNAHMEMEGRYTCLVQTSQTTQHTEFNLIVIVDACKESVWNMTLDEDNCSEKISMNCKGIFPKPSPQCGVYNEATQTYLTSVPFDRVITLRNGTYDVTLNRDYHIRDWISYKNISFRCYFVIDGTSWKRGIRHKLFGAYGCPSKPPSPGPGFYNISEETSCWNIPADGATATYTCNANKKLTGPKILHCRNGNWISDKSDNSLRPYCNAAINMDHHIVTLFVSIVFLLPAHLALKL